MIKFVDVRFKRWQIVRFRDSGVLHKKSKTNKQNKLLENVEGRNPANFESQKWMLDIKMQGVW